MSNGARNTANIRVCLKKPNHAYERNDSYNIVARLTGLFQKNSQVYFLSPLVPHGDTRVETST